MTNIIENIDIIVFVITFLSLLLFLFHKNKRWLIDNHNKVDIKRLLTLLVLTGAFGSITLCVVALIKLAIDGFWPEYISVGRVTLSIMILSSFGIAFILLQIYEFVYEMISAKGEISQKDKKGEISQKDKVISNDEKRDH